MPTGQETRINKAESAFNARINQAARLYRAVLDNPQLTITRISNAATYRYDLSAAVLENILAEIDRAVDRIMEVDGRAEDLWFTKAYMAPAYANGTAVAFANLAAQSPTYATLRTDLATLLSSDAYRNRLGKLAAREFENMKGFTGELKAELSRALVDGMAIGRGPREVATMISEATGVEYRRAKRIARTELNNAFRQARMDEAEQTSADLGFRVMMLHLSALSPTTRASHAARHAKLYSVTDVRIWYTQDANSINCKCSQVETLVDASGAPLVPGTIERAKQWRK